MIFGVDLINPFEKDDLISGFFKWLAWVHLIRKVGPGSQLAAFSKDIGARSERKFRLPFTPGVVAWLCVNDRSWVSSNPSPPSL
jgi:hypothetical protein